MVNNTSKIEKMGFISKHTLQTSPKQLPPKTTKQESSLKAMISMD